jgi:hypothetical protein
MRSVGNGSTRLGSHGGQNRKPCQSRGRPSLGCPAPGRQEAPWVPLPVRQLELWIFGRNGRTDPRTAECLNARSAAARRPGPSTRRTMPASSCATGTGRRSAISRSRTSRATCCRARCSSAFKFVKRPDHLVALGALARRRAAKAARGVAMFAACGQIIKTDLTKY